MNDQAILEQLAQYPRSRAVQLADRLDQPLEDVQATLAGLIAVGDVTATAGTSPAGMPCQLYDLTEAFKASSAYEPILAKTLAAQFAVFRPDLGKTDRAVEFVRERGMATSSELHAVLGLEPHEYASTYLKSALNGGRLVKEGKTWTLGPKEAKVLQREAKDPVVLLGPFPTVAPTAAPPEVAVKDDALESGAELGRIAKPELQIPAFTPFALTPDRTPKQRKVASNEQAIGAAFGPKHRSAPAAPASTKGASGDTPAPPRYRFAIWSDGQVEIQRNGMPLAQLPRAVADDFANFVRESA